MTTTEKGLREPEKKTKRRPKAKATEAAPAGAGLPPAADGGGPRYHVARLDPLDWTTELALEHADRAREADARLWPDTMNRWRYDGPVVAVLAYQEKVGCDLEEARQIVERWARNGGYDVHEDIDYTLAPALRDPEADPVEPIEVPTEGWALSDEARTRSAEPVAPTSDPMDAFEEGAPAAPVVLPPDPEAQPRREPPVRDEHPPTPRRVIGHKVEDVAFDLDPMEFRDRAQILARVEEEISDEEKRHAQIKADMKATMTALAAKRAKYSLIVRDGREYRPTRLTLEQDLDAGVVREITPEGRVHKSRPLREDERQTSLFGDEEAEP